jgi:hypothetical protein
VDQWDIKSSQKKRVRPTKRIVTEIFKNVISPTCFDLNPGEHIQSALSQQRSTLEKLAERSERNRLIKSFEKKDTVTVTKEKVTY